MKLKSIDIVLSYILEIIEEDGSITLYRRDVVDEIWEQLMGNSWESIFHNYEELEEIFKEWQRKQNQTNQE